MPFVVVLNNIRSLYNVGSIFRTSDGAGVEKIWICGKTTRNGSESERHTPKKRVFEKRTRGCPSSVITIA